MAGQYRIFGAELSPYSVKVRSYCRYKGIPHQWIIRSAAVQEDYNKYAKLPIIPLVVTPKDKGIQDSTPIRTTRIPVPRAFHPPCRSSHALPFGLSGRIRR